ncbi:hypothetical protein L0F63_001069, partial [Massospora cicadina]
MTTPQWDVHIDWDGVTLATQDPSSPCRQWVTWMAKMSTRGFHRKSSFLTWDICALAPAMFSIPIDTEVPVAPQEWLGRPSSPSTPLIALNLLCVVGLVCSK